MHVLLVLEFFCFLTVYLSIGTTGLTLPLNLALDSSDPFTIVSLNVSDPAAVGVCTSSLIWAGSTGYDSMFTDHCFQAWREFVRTDLAMYKSIQFEFLQQGVTPSHPGVRTMATPRRYVKGESTNHFENQVMSLTTL